MNQITVRYFASIREAMGTGSDSLQTAAATVGALRAELMGKSEAAAQALAEGRAVRMTLNHAAPRDPAPKPRGPESWKTRLAREIAGAGGGHMAS